MIRIINNYSFINEQGAMVNPVSKQKGKFYLLGKYTESWIFFVGTETCLTSVVTKITNELLVVTQDGNEYRLGTISPDYRQFLEATKKGISAVSNWSIYGSKKYGYYLMADEFLEKKAIATSKIIAQKGNFLVIRKMAKTLSGENVWNDPELVFVCWDTASKNVVTQIKQNGMLADIKYSDFKMFNGSICKPNLFKET